MLFRTIDPLFFKREGKGESLKTNEITFCEHK